LCQQALIQSFVPTGAKLVTFVPAGTHHIIVALTGANLIIVAPPCTKLLIIHADGHQAYHPCHQALILSSLHQQALIR
jgi:hypothetical protein